MEKIKTYFKLDDYNTSIPIELYAGLVTYLAGIYIIFLVPTLVGGNLHLDKPSLLVLTAVVSGVMTIFTGLFSNMPLLIAPGVSCIAWFTFGIIFGHHATLPQALFAVFISGVFILLSSVFKLRGKMMDSLPDNLQHSVAIGIGIFIAIIGLKESHMIKINSNTLAEFNAHSIAFWTNIFNLLLLSVCYIKNIRFGVVLAIIVTIVVGLITGDSHYNGIFAMPHIAHISSVFEVKLSDMLSISIIILGFITFLSDFFDASGTFLSITAVMDERPTTSRSRRAMLSEGGSTMVGSMFGLPALVGYLESHAGIAVGGKTGLVAVVTGLLFIASAFLTPLLSLLPTWAFGSILVYIGALIALQLGKIDWTDRDTLIPCFLAILLPGLTYSIPNGIGMASLSLLVIRLTQGKKDYTVNGFLLLVSVLYLILLFSS